MDIRLKGITLNQQKKDSGSSFNSQSNTNNAPDQVVSYSSEQELKDSIIFNIMKKIQIRERLIAQYKTQKQQQNSTYVTKYLIHSNSPIYYTLGVVLAKVFKFSQLKSPNIQSIITVPNLLFHLCVVISINQYGKYDKIFSPRNQMASEYRIYQQNVQNLMEEKLRRFSLLNKLQSAHFMDQQKLIKILKYRLVV